MAASNETVASIIEVVLRHVDQATARRIVADLLAVNGNASFRETVRRMSKIIEQRDD